AGVIETLRRDDGGPERFVASIAQAHVCGARVNWGALLDGRAVAGVQLPTYPFQRHRYWLSPQAGAGDATWFGQSADQHPLLGAMVALADGDGVLLTGRVSLQAHRWLADHALMGVVLFPGAAFLELALHAAARVGCEMVDELTLESPLVL